MVKIYEKAKPEQKKILIKLVFESLTLDNGVLNWKHTKPFQILHDAVKATNSSKLTKSSAKDNKIFEPSEKVDTSTQITSFSLQRPAWLPRVDKKRLTS